MLLNPKYPETYKVKGRQLFYQKQYDSALIAFTQANSMRKDLPSFIGRSLSLFLNSFMNIMMVFSFSSFIGVIECNIALGKFKDAANAAREMVLLFQKSAEVYYVMGTVLAKSPQGAPEVCLIKSEEESFVLTSTLLIEYSSLWKSLEDSTTSQESGDRAE